MTVIDLTQAPTRGRHPNDLNPNDARGSRLRFKVNLPELQDPAGWSYDGPVVACTPFGEAVVMVTSVDGVATFSGVQAHWITFERYEALAKLAGLPLLIDRGEEHGFALSAPGEEAKRWAPFPSAQVAAAWDRKRAARHEDDQAERRRQAYRWD